MIVTVTPNPSVDRTVFVDALPRGAVIRSARSRTEPSGKGVNVALALATRGYEALAVLPVGGAAGVQIVDMLRAAALPHVTVRITGDIRSNISLVEPDGTVTKINELGPILDVREINALAAAALQQREHVSWLACCGSLPAGAGEELYSYLTREGHRRGIRVAVDSGGGVLRNVLPYGPDLVKPNAEELADAARRSLETLGDVIDAAETLRQQGASAVLASLGPDGAVLLDGQVALHAETPTATVVSAVGAGDALLAGFLAAGGEGVDALREAMCWAAAAVEHEGTVLPDHRPAVTVTVCDDVDRHRRLADPIGRSHARSSAVTGALTAAGPFSPNGPEGTTT